jgi:hypothetical protein
VLKVILILLLIGRVALSVYSTAGISWDFANYYRTGKRIFNGQEEDLYRTSLSNMRRFKQFIGEHLSEQTRSPKQYHPESAVFSGRYGHIGLPISAYVFAPLGAFKPRYALLVFKAQSVLFLASALLLLYPLFQKISSARIRKDLILPLYLFICLFYEPFWFVFATGGQATPLNLFLFVLFHRFYVQDRPLLATLFLSFGILIKPFFVLTVLIFVFARDFRTLRSLIMWLSFEAILSVAVLGWPLHLEWMNVMGESARGLAEPWWNNSAILALFYNFWSVSQGAGLDPAGEIAGPFLGVVIAFKILVILMFFRFVRYTQAQDLEPQQVRHHMVSLAILFALCFSNIIWPHYLAFLFVPLLFLLVPSLRLPRNGEILAWLILISTLAVQSRFAQRYVLSLLINYPLFQASVAGVFGSGTLILTLVLLMFYHRHIIRSQRALRLFPQAIETRTGCSYSVQS